MWRTGWEQPAALGGSGWVSTCWRWLGAQLLLPLAVSTLFLGEPKGSTSCWCRGCLSAGLSTGQCQVPS